MCGFYGWILSDKFQDFDAHSVALKLTDMLRLRGANDAGYVIGNRIEFGWSDG